MDKKQSRMRRARKTRSRIKKMHTERLCVHRTPRHIYVQIISACGSKVLASASTLDSELKGKVDFGGNVKAAAEVGALIAQRAKKLDLSGVVFDRSGFRYHGRIKALAESAREKGLKF